MGVERWKAEVEQWKCNSAENRLIAELLQAEVERLNQITKVSAMDDYAEVDRLRAELATAWSNAEKNARDCDDLRAQLAQPDHTGSETPELSMWKNPLISMQERLQIADGAIAFRDGTINNLRAQLAQKVVLPERAHTHNLFHNVWQEGWNACLDEVARLNGAKP
jgi:uncharacterized membrane protein YccC